MSREQLEQFALRIQNELEREREERNFFQLERDKLRTFWEITRQQLDEQKAELRLICFTYRWFSSFLHICYFSLLNWL